MRYFLHLAYNGSNFHGWQIQNNAITVQQVLNDALSLYFRTPIELNGAGRTDAGVHASDYYAHFELENPIIDSEIPKIVYKLNGLLANDILIYNIFHVEDSAHARFDAISRTYKYYINTKKNIFNIDFSYTFYGRLDVEKMNEACKVLFAYTDFSCFSKSNTQTKTNNCKIMQANWEQIDNGLIFTITADRFLRNMVRAVVGTLMEIGKGNIEIEDIHKIIESKNRSKAGFSVPAKGLFLSNIEYPQGLLKK
jgi:tRNA pseudouridine38-40 synthase